MRNPPFFLPALIATLVWSSAPAAYADGGGQERSFGLGLSARSVGLGGALAALPDDASSAMNGNPAALAGLSRGQISLFHAPLQMDTLYDAFCFALPSLNRGTLGLSAAMVTVPGIEQRDALNFRLGTIDYSEQQVALAYAFRISHGISLGVEGFWTRLKMGDVQDASYSADFGLHGTRRLTDSADALFGLSLRDWVQTGLQLGAENDKTTPSVALGAGLLLRPGKHAVLFLIEPDWLKDNGLRLKGGVEFQWAQLASLRGGWNGSHLNAGAGLTLRSFSLDYALSLQDSFGMTHRASLSYRFGRDVLAAVRDRRSREDRMKTEILEKLKRDSIKTYLSAGDRYLSGRKYEEAKQEYSKILAWDARDASALARLAKVQKAEKDNWLKEGRRLVGSGDYLDAMVKFKAVLDADPSNSSAKKELKNAEEKIRIDSKRAFASVKTLPADEAQRYFEDGLNLYMAGRYTQALDKWKVIIAANPINRQIFEYVSRAQVKLEADRMQTEQKKEKAVRQSRVQLLQKQAIQSYQKGDLKGAVDAWKELLKADPQNAEARTQLEKSEKELLDSRKRGVRW